MKEIFTIVNPAAGGGRCGKQAPSSLERLGRAGLSLEVRHTSAAGHAQELAQEAYALGYRRFITVGGDGTSYEVVNGLFPRPEGDTDELTLGMLPLGTGNSFLRDFGITDGEAAVAALTRWEQRPCDVVRAAHADGVIHYINLLSLGFSAHAGALTNDRFKPFGTLGYVMAVLVCVAKLEYPVLPFSVDGGELDRRRAALLSFSNSRFTGGTMMMAPPADVSDGLLDVIRVGELGRMRFVGSFPRIFAGTHMGRPDIEHLRARRVDFEEMGSQDVMVDGEIVNLDLRHLEVLPGALRVIA